MSTSYPHKKYSLAVIQRSARTVTTSLRACKALTTDSQPQFPSPEPGTLDLKARRKQQLSPYRRLKDSSSGLKSFYSSTNLLFFKTDCNNSNAPGEQHTRIRPKDNERKYQNNSILKCCSTVMQNCLWCQWSPQSSWTARRFAERVGSRCLPHSWLCQHVACLKRVVASKLGCRVGFKVKVEITDSRARGWDESQTLN